MQKVLMVSGIIILLLVVGYVFLVEFTDKVETQKYEVEMTEDDFEVRIYPRAIMATTMTSGNYKKSSGKGFRKLAGYIFGGNEEEEKIAMTAPVWMTTEGEQREMSFVMPSKYEMTELPNPTDTSVIVERFNGGRYASIRFGGYANDEVIEQKTTQLLNWLKKKGYSPSTQIYFAGYNAPWRSYNRRNEVLIAL